MLVGGAGEEWKGDRRLTEGGRGNKKCSNAVARGKRRNRLFGTEKGQKNRGRRNIWMVRMKNEEGKGRGRDRTMKARNGFYGLGIQESMLQVEHAK